MGEGKYVTGDQIRALFQKTTLSDSGRIESVLDGETIQKSPNSCPRNVGEFVLILGTLRGARPSPAIAQDCSTDLNLTFQAEDIWVGIEK